MAGERDFPEIAPRVVQWTNTKIASKRAASFIDGTRISSGRRLRTKFPRPLDTIIFLAASRHELPRKPPLRYRATIGKAARVVHEVWSTSS
ncbi:hypothetical protein CQ10_34595 [Bradyrhizobium valentinum]|nr:hypothetical protein CQ10_34595 [Bradyrhizobium valentinum]